MTINSALACVTVLIIASRKPDPCSQYRSTLCPRVSEGLKQGGEANQ